MSSVMSNEQIAAYLREVADLYLIEPTHQNMKTAGLYHTAATNVSKSTKRVGRMELEDMKSIAGIGPSIADAIDKFLEGDERDKIKELRLKVEDIPNEINPENEDLSDYLLKHAIRLDEDNRKGGSSYRIAAYTILHHPHTVNMDYLEDNKVPGVAAGITASIKSFYDRRATRTSKARREGMDSEKRTSIRRTSVGRALALANGDSRSKNEDLYEFIMTASRKEADKGAEGKAKGFREAAEKIRSLDFEVKNPSDVVGVSKIGPATRKLIEQFKVSRVQNRSVNYDNMWMLTRSTVRKLRERNHASLDDILSDGTVTDEIKAAAYWSSYVGLSEVSIPEISKIWNILTGTEFTGNVAETGVIDVRVEDIEESSRQIAICTRSVIYYDAYSETMIVFQSYPDSPYHFMRLFTE